MPVVSLMDMQSDSEVMGSILSRLIERRLRRGVNLQTRAGGGTLAFNRPAETPASAPGSTPGGPMAMLKNPLVLGGLAAGGLLVALVIMKKRKKKKGA